MDSLTRNSGTVYRAGRIKRHRATRDEMEDRAEFLVSYAVAHGPVTVRQLFYAATVVGKIDKIEGGYNKIQAQDLSLQREGRLSYDAIADATRYMRKPLTFDGWEDGLATRLWNLSRRSGVPRPSEP